MLHDTTIISEIQWGFLDSAFGN